MPTPARIQEQLVAFGFKKQADIATANILAGIWRLNKLNAGLAKVDLATEDDSAELGKGHEFATTVFKTNWNVGGSLEKYASAEWAAWAMVFGLGKSAKTGTPPNYVYTCTPPAPVTDGIELPYFSFLETIRQGGSAILDRMAVGCAIEDVMIDVSSGPGRAASKITANFVGSGKVTEPSTITLPDATAEKLLPSASLAATIIGVDYVNLKNIISLKMGWKNNLKVGFFPGSGFQTGGDATTGAIAGRLEVGQRVPSLSFIARMDSASAERTKVLALTTGTAVISLTYDTNNSLAVTFQKVGFSVAEIGENDGLVSISVEARPLYHATNGLISAVAKCNIDAIGE